MVFIIDNALVQVAETGFSHRLTPFKTVEHDGHI